MGISWGDVALYSNPFTAIPAGAAAAVSGGGNNALNPFDDDNGAFKGSDPQVPVEKATAGPDLSGQYWDQYGAGAMVS